MDIDQIQQRTFEKLSNLRPQQPQSRPVDYVGENGLSAKEIAEELQKFSERLHVYSLTEQAEKDYKHYMNKTWNEKRPKKVSAIPKKLVAIELWESEAQ